MNVRYFVALLPSTPIPVVVKDIISDYINIYNAIQMIV
jgi:hypothetical protein